MKSVAIDDITQATRGRWLSAAEACPYATYFHTPYWYDIIAPKQKHIALDVTFNDGASAVIPIAEIKRMGGLLTDHFSSPCGTYGGWLSTSNLGEEHIKLLISAMARYKNLTFRINPFDETASSVISSLTTPSSAESSSVKPSLAGLTVTGDFTHTLDLKRDARAIFTGLTRGHKNAINFAARNGVTVRAAESFDEWEKYYCLYRGSVERWRAGGASRRPRSVYSLPLFRRVYENRTGNEILWLAVREGEPIAGVLFFYWGVRVVAWHGAASAERFSLRPNNLLFWEVMLDAARRGYEIFDFNPSGGYGGVESFKRHFGAKPVSSPVISTKTPLRKIIAKIPR